MSHSYPGQQQGSQGMQWKQHMLAKQMQEIQRQQQGRQLHLGARQQNTLNQVLGAAGQVSPSELPTMLSGLPVTHATNFMPGELMGGESKSLSNYPMHISGNMNWGPQNMLMMEGVPNGLVFSQEHGQFMQSMGYVPAQLDQSLHGTPVSGNMESLHNNLQLQGMSHDRASLDLMSKLGETHAERTVTQPFVYDQFYNDQHVVQNDYYPTANVVAGRQGAQAKTIFGNTFVQRTDGAASLQNIQRANHMIESIDHQGFQDRQEQANWSGKSHKSLVAAVTSPCGATSLDPTEEKILFGGDDDINWSASLGASGNSVAGAYLNGYPIENNDFCNVFPSIQSGTWSALVQEALEVSSSDTGHQEEWSGLMTQKTEPHSGKHSVFLSDSEKQIAVREGDGNLFKESSLTSKPFSLSNPASATQSFHSMPGSEHPLKFSYEQNERLKSDDSVQSIQLLPKETSGSHFIQSHQLNGYSLKGKQQQQNVPDAFWACQTDRLPMNIADSSDMGFNSHEIPHSWIHQQKNSFRNINSQANNKIAHRSIESPSPDQSHVLHYYDNGILNKYDQSSDMNDTKHMEIDLARNIGKVGGSGDAVSLASVRGSESSGSDNKNHNLPGEYSCVGNYTDYMLLNTFRSNIDQQLLNRHPVGSPRHVAPNPFVKDNEANLLNHQNQLSKFHQAWDISMACTNQEPVEMHDNKKDTKGYDLSHLHHSQNSDKGAERYDSLVSGNDRGHLVSGGQNPVGHSDRRHLGPRRFQFHPMGNLEIKLDPVNQDIYKTHAQASSHPGFWGSKNQERESFVKSKFIGHIASAISADVVKSCLIDSQKDEAIAEIQNTGSSPGHIPTIQSLNAPVVHIPQDEWTGFPSETLPVPLHNSDQSDDSHSAFQHSLSDHNAPSSMPDAAASDVSTFHLQHNQSNLMYDSALKLAPPPRRQSALHDSLTMHASLEMAHKFGQTNLQLAAEAAHQTWSSSTSSTVIPTILEAPQRENLEDSLAMSLHAGKEVLYSDIQGNSMRMINNLRNQSIVQQPQQPQQNNSCTSHLQQPVNQSFNKVDVESHLKCPHTPHSLDSGDRSPANQTSQSSLPGMPGEFHASGSSALMTNGAYIASQLYSQNKGSSDMINASYNQMNASQHHSIVETKSASQSLARSEISQQGVFPNIFNNVWRNAANKKMVTNLLQSMAPLQPPSKVSNQSTTAGGNSSSDMGVCSINSQQFTYREEYPPKENSEQKPILGLDGSPSYFCTSHLPDQVSKNLADKNIVSASSIVDLHHQDIGKGKDVGSQKEKLILPTVSTSNHDANKHNYSLLHQMQAMKGVNSDPSKITGKNFDGTDSSVDLLMVDKGQRHAHEQISALRESDAGTSHSDSEKLSFSSKDDEERSANASSQHIVGDSASHVPAFYAMQLDLPSSSLSRSSMLTFTGGNIRRPNNSQMAPSWFEQYGTYKNGQTSAISNSLGSLQMNAKAAAQHYFFSKSTESMDNTLVKKRNDSIQANSSPSDFATKHHPSASYLNIKHTDENLAPIRKKRKIVASDNLPWHKVVMHGFGSLHSLSMAEMKWSRATNRLIEKIEDEYEIMEDVPSTTRSRRRLVLTTQLMQQLFPHLPAKHLFVDALTSYEEVIYCIAKQLIREACRLISCVESESHLLECGNMMSGKINTSKKMREELFSKVLNSFMERSRKLQSNFLRLEGGSLIIDTRMECQDIERCSIINRFAKFHGRAPGDVFEGSSTSETAHRRSFLQRNVTAVPLPRNLPESVICLSL